MTKEQEELEKINNEINNLLKHKNKYIKAAISTFNILVDLILELTHKDKQLKEKDAEIEKYKKLLADNLARNLNDSIKAKEKADTDLEDLNIGWQLELEKKDKMIDLTLEFLAERDLGYYQKEEGGEIQGIFRKYNKDDWKQYFERKVTNGG